MLVPGPTAENLIDASFCLCCLCCFQQWHLPWILPSFTDGFRHFSHLLQVSLSSLPIACNHSSLGSFPSESVKLTKNFCLKNLYKTHFVWMSVCETGLNFFFNFNFFLSNIESDVEYINRKKKVWYNTHLPVHTGIHKRKLSLFFFWHVLLAFWARKNFSLAGSRISKFYSVT